MMISREKAEHIIRIHSGLDEIKAAKKKLRSLKAEAVITIYVGDNDDGVTIFLNRKLTELVVKNKETALLAELNEAAK